MNVRKMVISDYESVYELWLSCKGMGINNIDDTREGIERFLERNPDTCFVAEWEEAIVGVILAGFDGRRGYIYHTAVLPEYRKKGIGTRLLDNAMNALDKLGAAKVGLLVFNDNTEGNAFWEKHGFFVRNDVVYRNKEIKELVKLSK